MVSPSASRAALLSASNLEAWDSESLEFRVESLGFIEVVKAVKGLGAKNVLTETF